MPSKFYLLRQGHAVEIEPGLSGKLNKEKKTLELSSGEVLNVGHNKNFFPSNEQDVKLSKQREYAEKSAKGGGGEFFHQYTSEGIPGSISDIGAYLTQSGDEYATRKQAQNQVSERISEESPYISGAATGANIATDIALTRGMSALKAAPLLTAGSAGSRIFTEPGEVVKDSLIAAGGGYIVDKTTGGLSKMAARRGAARAIPGQQQAVSEANALEAQQFNALKQNVKSVNESRLKQHQVDLETRQNQIVKDQNDYAQRKLQRDAEVIRLKNKMAIAPPPKPSLMSEPVAPIPQPMPTLPPAQGMAERAADLLEKPLLGGGGQGIVNNPLVKLGGLKYLLGKAALPAEAAYLGMKGLTSPTALGEAARMTFKQGGIQAILSWAKKYPSYHNGILENPQERRSLTKEVEDDPEIPIEQKAVIQSKINRGKPLQERL